MIDIFKLLILKGRNIYYYMRIDPRPRSQYIHVVRDYRKRLKEFLIENESHSERDLIKDLLNLIPVKVTSSECYQVMESVVSRLDLLSEMPEKASINPDQEFDE